MMIVNSDYSHKIGRAALSLILVPAIAAVEQATALKLLLSKPDLLVRPT
jgi:hypothetical protein